MYQMEHSGFGAAAANLCWDAQFSFKALCEIEMHQSKINTAQQRRTSDLQEMAMTLQKHACEGPPYSRASAKVC